MAPLINIVNSPDELGRFFGLKLAAQLRRIPEGSFYSIALSGGSTPGAVFEYLAKHFREIIAWHKVLVFWGDERCVVPESEESNFRMAEEKLLDHVPIPSYNIFRIKGEADPFIESKRYAELTRQHLHLQSGIPQFNMVMLGLGEDGHTASIFPNYLKLFDSDQLFAATQHPGTGQNRITATGTLINRAKSVIFLVTGESKAGMVARVTDKREGWEKLPASYVRPENGKLLWLLDKEAASKLKIKS